MAKDTYWFPHDYEPTSDPKMQAMLGDYGGLGYGIYWRIVEMLHSDSTHKLPFKKFIFSAIVKQMQPNAKQNKVLLNAADLSVELVESFVKDCIGEYELFVSDNTHFWSDRAVRNIEKKESISEERSKAGKNGAEAKKNKAIGKQSQASDKQTQAITPHNTTLDKIRRDYIKNNTHHHYSDKTELKNAAAAVIIDVSTHFENFNGISNRHVDFLSKKISEKYINEQPIKNLRSLVLEWMERDKKSNHDEYVNHKEFSPL